MQAMSNVSDYQGSILIPAFRIKMTNFNNRDNLTQDLNKLELFKDNKTYIINKLFENTELEFKSDPNYKNSITI